MPLLDIVLALVVVALVAYFLNTRSGMEGRVRLTLNVVLMLIVVGIALWLVNTFIPMAGSIKAILNIIVVVATIVGVLQAFGLWTGVVRFWDNLTHNTTTPRQ